MANIKHCKPKMIKSSKRSVKRDPGGFCPMKSTTTPPCKYPRVASLACGGEKMARNSRQRMFGMKMAKTCGRWAGIRIRKSSDLGLRKSECGIERSMRRKKEQLLERNRY
jgi:hypothetical protein